MKILVCTDALSKMDGSLFHRVYHPFKDLSECGLQIDFCADFLSQQFSELLNYDVIVVSRTITYNPYWHKQAMLFWHNMPKSTRLVVDLDDYWNIPENHPNIQFWKRHDTKQCIIDTMRIASDVWTTNKHLAKKIDKVASSVTIVPNAIRPISINKTKSYTIRIGIVVNNTHEMNLGLLKSGLKTLDVNKYELLLIGADSSRRSIVNSHLGLEHTKLRYKHIGWKKPTEYQTSFEDVDVMLCPLAKIPFNKYRSRIKLEEAVAYQFKVVAIDFTPYSGQAQSGIKVVPSFNNLDEILMDLEKQALPVSVDTWQDVQQLRLDRLNTLVYGHN